jgi:hypothetical protein
MYTQIVILVSFFLILLHLYLGGLIHLNQHIVSLIFVSDAFFVSFSDTVFVFEFFSAFVWPFALYTIHKDFYI